MEPFIHFFLCTLPFSKGHSFKDACIQGKILAKQNQTVAEEMPVSRLQTTGTVLQQQSSVTAGMDGTDTWYHLPGRQGEHRAVLFLFPHMHSRPRMTCYNQVFHL